jgi:hypothetical protein
MSEDTTALPARMNSRGLRACPICADRRFYAVRMGFEHTTGSRPHGLDLVICARCGKTDFFVDDEPAQWVAKRAGTYSFLEYTMPEQGPYRG